MKSKKVKQIDENLKSAREGLKRIAAKVSKFRGKTNESQEKVKSNAQYLSDYLKKLETIFSDHQRSLTEKRYQIYRDGYLYTGTDSFNDVEKLVNNDLGIYTYKVNNGYRLDRR